MPPRARSRKLAAVPAPAVGEMEQAVRETLRNVTESPEDAGVRALALRYGRTIDESRALADAAADLPYDPDTAVMVARLKQRVEAQAVVAELGPKLLATLDALQATPKARAVAGKPAPAAGQSKLSALRDEGA